MTYFSAFRSTVFAIAAQEAGLEHVVSMGQWLAHERHPFVTNRETWLADKITSRLSGATHTVINAGWFADNYFLELEAMAQKGMMPMPLGDGLNAPPCNEDIARVVVGSYRSARAFAERIPSFGVGFYLVCSPR